MSEKIYDCEPTLTDLQVIEFCQKGFLMLEAVVPDEINRRTLKYLDERPGTQVGVNAQQPDEILGEDWFVEGVIQDPQGAGAVRSLLGKNFKLPTILANHRVPCPRTLSGGWHRDGGGMFTWELNHLQVF